MTINTPFPPHPPSFTPNDPPDLSRLQHEPIKRCDHCGLDIGGEEEYELTDFAKDVLNEIIRLANRRFALRKQRDEQQGD